MARDGRRLTIVPPEGVPLHFRLAGIGARLGAQLLDLLVTVAAALVLGLALVQAFRLDFGEGAALVSLIAFAVRTPYYVATELVWNGRTLAKRWLGLRTVSRDGRSLRVYQVVVRNLMREIEFFTPLLYMLSGFGGGQAWLGVATLVWITVLVLVPVRSRTNARLGDIIAGTAVIEEPKALLPPDVSLQRAPMERERQDEGERFVFSTAQLDAYGAYELQVLERLLRPTRAGKANTSAAERRRQQTLRDVAERIQAKIGYEEAVPERDVEAFLAAFYRAERAYLESRRLFGDRRDDKRYRETEREGQPSP